MKSRIKLLFELCSLEFIEMSSLMGFCFFFVIIFYLYYRGCQSYVIHFNT